MSRGRRVLLVAHGTRNPLGRATLRRLTALVQEAAPELRVDLAFAEAAQPSLAEAMAGRRNGEDAPPVIVPAFLAAGYHVRTDLPRQAAALAGPRCATPVCTPPLGPDPALAAAQVSRLRDAGWAPGDAVVMAAVASSDPRARADVQRAGGLLAARLRTPVTVTLCSADAVDAATGLARAAGARRVAVSPYLLAEGHFLQQLDGCAADVVARPLGADPTLARLILRRVHVAGEPQTVLPASVPA